MKILVYTDGKPHSAKTLQFAASLVKSLQAEMNVITVRSGTHAIESPPPYGRPINLDTFTDLPQGIQVLAHARRILAQENLLDGHEQVVIREMADRNIFTCQDADGGQIQFCVCFGHAIDVLNHEIDRHRYDLLIITPPYRSRLHGLVLGDATRKLALEIWTSILIVRQGQADSRFVICVDGSAASRRQFPLLKMILPAISSTVEIICIRAPDADDETVQKANHCLKDASQLLTACGKKVEVQLLESSEPAKDISAILGQEAVIVVGGSLRHHAYRSLRGSLALDILSQTAATTLIVKTLPESSSENSGESDSCPYPPTILVPP